MEKEKLHIRPPHDLLNPMLRVSEGCSHGKCHFCSLYPDTRFAPVPLEDVREQVEGLAKKSGSLTRRIFLSGGNPYALPTKHLIEIFDIVEEAIPTVTSYGGFCRISDVAHKSDEDLRLLRSRGVNEITIGAESGCDETLQYMEKDHTHEDIVEQAQRLHDAGIEFIFFYLAGMAGHGKGQQNAIDSARAFSAASPKRILITTLTPTKQRPLRAEIEAGLWTPSGEVEAAEEIRTFIENLTCNCNVNCSHDTDIIRFEGMVPEKQKEMIELLDNRIPLMDENASRVVREHILGSTW